MDLSSFLLAAGVVVGLAWVARLSRFGEAGHAIDDGMIVLTGALIGSRIAFAAVHWSYYRQHLVEIPQVWLGGLSGAGAMVGAVLILLVFAGFSNQTPGKLADRLLPLGAAVSTSAWLACWVSGSAYGPEASGAWWGLPTPDEAGILATRWPVPLVGAALTLGLYWLLEVGARRFSFLKSGRSGKVAALGWLGISLVTFGLSFLRVDPTPHWNGMRLDTWAYLGLGAAGLVAFLLACLPSRGHEVE